MGNIFYDPSFLSHDQNVNFLPFSNSRRSQTYPCPGFLSDLALNVSDVFILNVSIVGVLKASLTHIVFYSSSCDLYISSNLVMKFKGDKYLA